MPAAFVLKTPIADPRARTFAFRARKTMYGGKALAVGDVVYLFDSENEGGTGLVARGLVTAVSAVPRRPGVARQTPRLNLTLARTGRSRRPLGRESLKGFAQWGDGRPETELNFKFYRQATNKLGGISPEAATFLEQFFQAG